MKVNLCTIFFILSVYSLAQAKEEFLVDQTTNPGLILKEIPQKKPVIEGSYYLYDSWKIGDLILVNNQSIKGIMLNVDLLNHLISILNNGAFKTIDLSIIKEIIIHDSMMLGKQRLVNMNRFHSNLTGIAMVLYEDDNCIVMENQSIVIKEPTYVPTHHIGNPNKQIVKLSQCYLIENSNYTTFKKRKGDILKLFKKENELVKEFIKSNNIRMTSNTDLAMLFDYAFSL